MIPDAKKCVISLLKSKDIPVSGDIKSSGRFVTVTLLGGAQATRVSDRARFKLSCFDSSPASCDALARRVMEVLDDLSPIVIDDVFCRDIELDGFPVEMWNTEFGRPYSQVLYSFEFVRK